MQVGKDVKFNTIISTEVIEHLDSPRNSLEFCRKMLERAGAGELIVSTPALPRLSKKWAHQVLVKSYAVGCLERKGFQRRALHGLRPTSVALEINDRNEPHLIYD